MEWLSNFPGFLHVCPYFKSLGCCTKFEERGDELLVWGDKTHVWSTQKVSFPGKTANEIGMFLSHIEGGVGLATFLWQFVCV